jgi:hypothetical protein
MLDFNSTSTLEITPVFCDWLTAEVKETKRESYLYQLFRRAPFVPDGRAAYGRTQSFREPTYGCRIYRTPDSDLDSVVVCDGACLGRIREQFGGGSCLKVSAIFCRHAENVSRIDLTLDIMDKGAFSYEIASDSLSDSLDTGRRKQYVYRESPIGTGCSLYVGVRTSPLYLRIYDKKSESKGKIQTTRIELECKGKLSKEIRKTLAEPLGHLKSSGLFMGLMRKCFDTSKYLQLERITYGDVHLVDIPPREEMMSKKEWLTRQVLPSFDTNRSTDASELWKWFQGEVNRASGTLA